MPATHMEVTKLLLRLSLSHSLSLSQHPHQKHAHTLRENARQSAHLHRERAPGGSMYADACGFRLTRWPNPQVLPFILPPVGLVVLGSIAYAVISIRNWQKIPSMPMQVRGCVCACVRVCLRAWWPCAWPLAWPCRYIACALCVHVCACERACIVRLRTDR